ncbi:FMN-binding glutamate synthase family protein, partial [Xanthomonas citri pv. citri]|nr:FMN-binding glutamate synthase family protein [Xanthomonas citri pv. citri]
VGSRVDVLAMTKAIWEERIAPDFIIVDGSEGGTGAAPLEYSDRVGTPLTEGLMLVHNALVGTGLRHMIKLGAAGKVATGSDIVKRLIQ